MWIFLGACAVVVAAAVVSNYTKKTSAHSTPSQHEPPQPTLQDNTDNNVQDLKNQLTAERQKEAQEAASQTPQITIILLGGTPAQQAIAAGLSPTGQAAPCAPGQPCQQQGVYVQPQISPEQQQAQQLAARERELAYNARFASNLVYTQTNAPQAAPGPDANPHSDGATQAATSQPSDPPARNLIPAQQAAGKRSDSSEELHPSGPRRSISIRRLASRM